MRISLLLIIMAVSVYSCRTEDTSRLNFISYNAERYSDLPLDTASCFNVRYTDESGQERQLNCVDRFSHTFSKEGDGEAVFRAWSADSLIISIKIAHNGTVVEEAVGADTTLKYQFR